MPLGKQLSQFGAILHHQADSNKYDTLPLSIDDVTVANATNLDFRILKKPHGLFIRRKPITSGSNEYQQIIVAVSKVDPSDPDLGIYAKLIVDMLIASAYNHDGEWRIDDANKLLWHKFPDLQDLIDAVTFRVLHMRAARDLNVHRNTLIYRLERIQELLGGSNLEHPETRLNLQLALKIRAALGGSTPN